MLEWSEKELMWPPGLQSSLRGVSHTCRKVTNEQRCVWSQLSWSSYVQQPNQSLFFSVFERYKRYSPYDIKESIRKEVKGDLEKSFLTLGIYQLSVLHTSCHQTVRTLKRCAWQIWWWLCPLAQLHFHTLTPSLGISLSCLINHNHELFGEEHFVESPVEMH